jgi:hypothetical protein
MSTASGFHTGALFTFGGETRYLGVDTPLYCVTAVLCTGQMIIAGDVGVDTA